VSASPGMVLIILQATWSVTVLTGWASLVSNDMEALWKDLGSESAPVAYQAIVKLATREDESPAFLRDKMCRRTCTEPATVRVLIADLESPDFKRRQRAASDLKDLGKGVEGPLREAAKRKLSFESRRRLEQVIKLLDHEILRDVRAVEALERIGNREAQDALRGVAADWPDTTLQQEIRVSLERLARATQSSSKD
jgi:hypothetical protein